MFQPLEGVRVFDLSQVLAGPYATYQLALMGAETVAYTATQAPARGTGGSL